MSAWGWIWRVGGVLVLLLALVVGGLMFYASTPHFANIVRQKVITVLEDATGGRVDLQSLRWNLRHLSVEVSGLTIHGLEAKGEMPYAHIDRLYARVKILSFFDARLGLDFLEVDRPAIHLIVYPNGSTNQPTPKAKQSASGPAIRTVFDLQARRVEVHNGVALINDRSIPFPLAATNLGVVELKALHFTSEKTALNASGSLTHFAYPQWKLAADGNVDLAEVTALGLVDGFRR